MEGSILLPTTMAAVLLTGHGGLDRLEYRTDVNVPRPSTGEVLIQVAAAGINNTDVNTRIGWYSKSIIAETGEGAAQTFAQDREAYTYRLDEIARAQEDFLKKDHIGKLVLVP